ncbi:MAG: hypothetical protein R3B70_39035 [Polyangiaceae bacterium]
MEGVYGVLESADPAILIATPRKLDHCVIQVRGRPARVEETWATRDAMLAGLRGQSGQTTPDDLPHLHAGALFIAAALDRAATEPFARRILLSPGSPRARSAAALALEGCRGDETVDALFSVLHEEGQIQGGKKRGPYLNAVRRGVEHALSATGREDVGARTLALLTPKALKIKTSPGYDSVLPSFSEQEKEDFVRALLYILGTSKYRPARPGSSRSSARRPCSGSACAPPKRSSSPPPRRRFEPSSGRSRGPSSRRT